MSERYVAAVPKYNWYDYQSGKCTDLEFYKSVYGGTGSIVTKYFAPVDEQKEHPFFLIKRKQTDGYGNKYFEFKVYDKTRGLLSKENVEENISNAKYWEEYSSSFDHTSYVEFLVDTFQITVERKKKTREYKKKDQD